VYCYIWYNEEDTGGPGPQPAQAPPRCTKCNSPSTNGQCTNCRGLLYNGLLLCVFNLPVKGLICTCWSSTTSLAFVSPEPHPGFGRSVYILSMKEFALRLHICNIAVFALLRNKKREFICSKVTWAVELENRLDPRAIENEASARPRV